MQDVTAQDTPAVLHRRERLLWVLSAATFIIFFQAFMVAPIIPALSHAFGTSVERVGLIVPAYLIPYGIATLAYGLLRTGWAFAASCWRLWQRSRCLPP